MGQGQPDNTSGTEPSGTGTSGIGTSAWAQAAHAERTLVICKPDAVERGLVGEIIGRLERRGLRLVRAELRQVDKETAASSLWGARRQTFLRQPHRPHHPGAGAPGRGGGATEGTWQVVRTMMGATNPTQAAPGTVRGDLALSMTENLIHGSDSAESARRE